MDSNIGFEMSLFVVEAIRGRCATFMILTATLSYLVGSPWLSPNAVGIGISDAKPMLTSRVESCENCTVTLPRSDHCNSSGNPTVTGRINTRHG